MGKQGETLRRPALRPAQLGVVLARRVTLGHIGATVVDLACRGCLRMEILDEDGSDWRLTVVRDEPEDLLSYEQALLHGLFGGQATLSMALITTVMAPVLDTVRAGIVRDALDAGRLRAGIARRFALTQGQRRRYDQNPDRRTRLGEELLKEIKNFKRDLRVLAAAGDTGTLARFSSYAMIFGLPAPLPVEDTVPKEPSGEALTPKQTTEFAACWQKAWRNGRSDFVPWSWSPYSEQTHGNASHHSHRGYAHDGGHGGFGGHHGGGIGHG
jgi:hypothetical protein